MSSYVTRRDALDEIQWTLGRTRNGVSHVAAPGEDAKDTVDALFVAQRETRSRVTATRFSRLGVTKIGCTLITNDENQRIFTRTKLLRIS